MWKFIGRHKSAKSFSGNFLKIQKVFTFDANLILCDKSNILPLPKNVHPEIYQKHEWT